MARYDVEGMLATVIPLIASPERVALTLPVYDRANRAMYERRRHLSIGSNDLLIVEGMPALLIDRLAESAGVRVHVEMPEAERVSRLHADYRWRGVSDATVESLLASRAVDETAPVETAKARAEFIVSAWTPA